MNTPRILALILAAPALGVAASAHTDTFGKSGDGDEKKNSAGGHPYAHRNTHRTRRVAVAIIALAAVAFGHSAAEAALVEGDNGIEWHISITPVAGVDSYWNHYNSDGPLRNVFALNVDTMSVPENQISGEFLSPNGTHNRSFAFNQLPKPIGDYGATTVNDIINFFDGGPTSLTSLTLAVSRDMVTKPNAIGGLNLTLDSMSAVTGGPRPDMPATGIRWYEAARFVNWLNTSQGFQPAYKFSIAPGSSATSRR